MKLILLFFLLTPNAYGMWGDGGAGWAQIPHLINILKENVKRYHQLKTIIKEGKHNREYLQMINAGLNNSIGLVESLPIEDKRLLHELSDFQDAYKTVLKVYGSIPKGKTVTMHTLHDETVAESVKMVGNIYRYAKAQENNAKVIAEQAKDASPKGAARMTAETNSQILHTLNQLLKINGQMLKLQSERLAMANKVGKDETKDKARIKQDITRGLSALSTDFNLPRF